MLKTKTIYKKAALAVPPAGADKSRVTPLDVFVETYEKQQDEISKLKEIIKHKDRVIEYILKYELTGCCYRREDYPLCYISHAENPNKMKHCQQCWNKYLNEKARVK